MSASSPPQREWRQATQDADEDGFQLSGSPVVLQRALPSLHSPVAAQGSHIMSPKALSLSSAVGHNGTDEAASSPESTWKRHLGLNSVNEPRGTIAMPPAPPYISGAIVTHVYCSLCRVEHPADRGCFYSLMTRALWASHFELFRHPSAPSAHCLPRTPTIAHFFLHNPEQSPVLEILNAAFRGFIGPRDADNVASYLLMYRLLRVSPHHHA